MDVGIVGHSLTAMMPFAKQRSLVAATVEGAGNRYFIARQVIVVTRDTIMNPILTSHERCTTWCTHSRGSIPASEHHPLLSQAIEVGRLPLFTSVKPDVSPTKIVSIEDHHVRQSFCQCKRR